MKKYLFCLTIAVLLLAACQPKQNDELGTLFHAGQEVTLTANMPSNNNGAKQLPSKQYVSGKDSNPIDPINGTINLTWDAGDMILVKVGDKTAEFTLQNGVGTAQATFKGVMPADGTEYSVQYPVSNPNLTSQTYVQNGFGQGLMKMETENNGTIDAGFTLKAKNALLGLQLTGNQILSKIVVTNPSDNKTYTLHCCPNVTLSAAPTLFYIVVPAGLWAGGFVVDVYVDDSIISSFERADAITFPTDIATIMPPKDISVSHLYVDLGLSVQWAMCNVGADDEADYGDYFAWGETQPKDKYIWSTYKYANGSATTLTKYGIVGATGIVDNKYNLDPEDDAATANWGYPWRMPTDDEISELINKCTWTLTTKNGVTGFLVKSKTNGNTIFLPAGGYMATNPQHQGIFGYYWSSTLYLMDNNGSQMSTELHFTSTKPFVAGFNRCVGCLVRPVYP